MNINNQKVNIDDLISQKYMHKMINDKIFLSDYQIDILKLYKINPSDYFNIEDLIFDIDEILQTEYDEELDNILQEIVEFNYYANTDK